LPENFRHLK